MEEQWALRRRSTIILAVALAAVVSCGYWPPFVESRREVERLPMTQVDLRARALDDADLTAIGRLRDLKQLDFTSGWARPLSARLSDRGLETLAGLDLPKLNHLSLGFCSKITDAGMLSVAKLKHLQELSSMGSEQITDQGLRALVRMPSLRLLDLRGCKGITDPGLDILTTKDNWDWIMLGGCSQVTQAGVKKRRKRFPGARVDKDDADWQRHLRAASQ